MQGGPPAPVSGMMRASLWAQYMSGSILELFLFFTFFSNLFFEV